MYKKQVAEYKKPAMLIMIAMLLFSFCFSVILNNVLGIAAIDSSKAGRLFSGDNVTATATPSGIIVAAKDKEAEASAEYFTTLAMEYTRTIPEWHEEGVLGNVTATTSGKEYFKMQFSIQDLFSDKIVFEFVDHVDNKKAVRVTLDFTNFNADEDGNSDFDIDVVVSYTEDKWKTQQDETTEIRIADNHWLGTDKDGATKQFFEGTNADFRPAILQSILFELEFNYDSEIVLRRWQMQPLDEGDDQSDPQANYIRFPDRNLYLPVSKNDLRFTHNTGRMTVKYETPRVMEAPVDNPTMSLVTAVLFRDINKQSLSETSESKDNALPAILRDRKIKDTTPLRATTFGVVGDNYNAYDGLKASRNANFVFPIVITDAANFSIYGYIEIWELDPDTGKITGSKPVETKEFNWTTAGLSYNFEAEGFYEVRIFAGSLNNTTEVKDAVKETDPTADNYGKVVMETLTYRVISDRSAGAPQMLDLTGVDLKQLVNDEFTTQWQALPEYDEDFSFPRPDGLFSNGIDEDYTLTFTIGYRHESDNNYQWSDSLDLRITRTGLFKFKYVVKAPSGKKNTDDNEYFYDEDYPEFSLIFSDLSAPEIGMSTYQRELTMTVGDYFTIPSPTVTDNSVDGGYVITDETKIWHAYSSWKRENGLYEQSGLQAPTKTMLEEVEFDDDDRLEMKKAGIFYFVVFYQAQDTHNNKTIGFPDESEYGDLSDEKWANSFWLIKVTVEEPESGTTNTTLLIVLIVLGGLSFIGIIVLLFIKPIDENKWQANREKARK